MESQELKELKRELYKEIDEVNREYKSFKKRVSTIANLFIPGLGFLLYGSSPLKGFITFALFSLYNLLFFKKILYNTDGVIAIIFYIPAVVIWLASTIMATDD